MRFENTGIVTQRRVRRVRGTGTLTPLALLFLLNTVMQIDNDEVDDGKEEKQ